MSRQVQIRRGTAAENDAFTGAIGEITMDTTNNTLRVHDGETVGGTVLAKQSEIPNMPDLTNADYVIESQLPTAENNYTWYRKYKSGWVEQGGRCTITMSSNGADTTVSLPQEMLNTNYTAIAVLSERYGGRTMAVQKNSITTTAIVIGGYVSSGTEQNSCFWTVYGMAK